MSFGRFRHLHFIGAGGVGMCGLAEIVLAQGLEVSGCDLALSDRTTRLAELGARVQVGHDPCHLAGADAVVVSAAVDADCSEVAEARRQGLPVIRRAELLAELMRRHHGVGVAGTHGKTTTTALIGHLLTTADLDPTVVVGGHVHAFGSHARLGQGRVMVCEADEFDRSFLALSPVWAVITNIEAEHLECYGSTAELDEAFLAFASRVPFWGAAVLCADDPGVGRIRARLDRRVLTYGLSETATVRAVDLEAATDGTRFSLVVGGRQLGRLQVPLGGVHNLRNALAALAVGWDLEIPTERMSQALASFSGVARRFEVRGERAGVTVVDDYAHHPTELSAAITAARQVFPGRRLVAVFQPHLFSRTQRFAADFAVALGTADVALVLPVYPAREAPIAGVTSELIIVAASQQGQRSIMAAASMESAAAVLEETLRSNDVVLTMGAGDVFKLAERWLEGAA